MMSDTGKVLTTDVLVIGGGIAGLCAANKAAEQGAKVLIVEKGVTPWTGQAPSAGGAFNAVPPEGVEAQVKFMIKEGEYLNDQDWTYTYTRDSHPVIFEMAQWGDLFPRDISGEIIYKPPLLIRLYRTDMFQPTLLGRAKDKGAKVLNRVYIADLLKYDGRVVGAVGFHYQTGEFYIIQSKTTIIACGGANYKSRPLFHINCGEGIAMAYHAGAELRNAEFCNTYMLSNKYTRADDRAADSVRRGYENALGEVMVDKYPELDPVREPGIPGGGGLVFRRWVRAMYREIEAGKGPIYLNLTKQPDLAEMRYQANIITHQNRTHGYVRMMQRLGIDVTKEKVEWTIVPEFHGGPIRVNLNCETTIPGLYATGDAVQNGSAYEGALEGCALPGGVPLAFAAVTGFRAGTAAGKSVSTIPEPKLNTTEVEKLKKKILAPLGSKGGYNPYDAIKEIQEIVFPFKNSYIKHKDRLDKALKSVEEVKAKLPNLTAKDSHELVRCHEAKSMVTNAETLYKASLMRTETRGTNIREDYPNRDDKNWLKWIIIRKEDEKMKFWTEPVPIGKYKHKP